MNLSRLPELERQLLETLLDSDILAVTGDRPATDQLILLALQLQTVRLLRESIKYQK